MFADGKVLEFFSEKCQYFNFHPNLGWKQNLKNQNFLWRGHSCFQLSFSCYFFTQKLKPFMKLEKELSAKATIIWGSLYRLTILPASNQPEVKAGSFTAGVPV